jgi:predicted nuclease of predicted toxin-antitoxin system
LNVAFYFDEHIPRAVALGLRIRGVDVITVQDDGRRGIADPLLLDRASELRQPLFSQDRDLLIEAQRRQKAAIFFAGLLYAHHLDITIGECVHDLHLIAEAMEPDELVNRVGFLPL